MVRVPLVVVTGFLGAGKTTLVNRLLARRAERGETSKLGVIVNELGEVGIDGALLGGESARQIELPGGCVCCVLGDELDTTLIELVDQNPSLSAILLETTGVAEPLPIAWAVRRAPVDRRIRLAAVVTLVDALHFLASRGVTAAVDAQVAYADVVLVTKSELATDHDIDAAIAAAHELAPQALIRRGTTDEHAAWLEQALADPSLEAPANPSGISPNGSPPLPGEAGRGREADAATEGRERAENGQVPVHVHDEHCRHTDNEAVHGIDTVWLPVPDEVDLEELEDQLATLPDNYVRIKGIVRSVDARDGAARRGWTVIHRVGLRVSSEPVGAPNFEEGRLVALGPRVERAALAECVEAAST